MYVRSQTLNELVLMCVDYMWRLKKNTELTLEHSLGISEDYPETNHVTTIIWTGLPICNHIYEVLLGKYLPY